MVENNKSIVSLLEIYKENTKTNWINDDIDFWFSTLKNSVIVCLLLYYSITKIKL